MTPIKKVLSRVNGARRWQPRIPVRKKGGGKRKLRISRKTLIRRRKIPIPLIHMISLADMITLGNFLCGIMAIMYSIDKGDGFRIAMLLILLGIILDGLDGPAARRWGSSHRFGKWLDSIADSMTFCIAPAFLIYNMFYIQGDTAFESVQNFVTIVASLSVIILGILRLARFSLTGFRWKDFVGLPTPAMAMIVISFTSLHFWLTSMEYEIEYVTSGTAFVIPTVLLILSFTMVFDVKYKKIKGLPTLVAGSAVLVMGATLIIGVHWAEVGLGGSLFFMAAAAFYLISPLADRSEGVWGASRRFSEEELLEIEVVEEGLEEDDFTECRDDMEVRK
ncbi:MAG: CDP-alcohol phosphatidyltransferase family protein [Thermoplasmatota archaeon]